MRFRAWYHLITHTYTCIQTSISTALDYRDNFGGLWVALERYKWASSSTDCRARYMQTPTGRFGRSSCTMTMKCVTVGWRSLYLLGGWNLGWLSLKSAGLLGASREVERFPSSNSKWLSHTACTCNHVVVAVEAAIIYIYNMRWWSRKRELSSHRWPGISA